MPYKYYMGKTGRVWNVSKRAVGVELLKTVGNRKRTKRIMVRVEHLRKSKCQTDFKQPSNSGQSRCLEFFQISPLVGAEVFSQP